MWPFLLSHRQPLTVCRDEISSSSLCLFVLCLWRTKSKNVLKFCQHRASRLACESTTTNVQLRRTWQNMNGLECSARVLCRLRQLFRYIFSTKIQPIGHFESEDVPLFLPITLPNIHQFSKFFHPRLSSKFVIKPLVKNPVISSFHVISHCLIKYLTSVRLTVDNSLGFSLPSSLYTCSY